LSRTIHREAGIEQKKTQDVTVQQVWYRWRLSLHSFLRGYLHKSVAVWLRRDIYQPWL